MTRRGRWAAAAVVGWVLAVAGLGSVPSQAATTRSVSLYAPTSATTGGVVVVHGALSHSPPGSVVVIRRRAGTRWVAAAYVTTTSGGRYTRSIRMPSTPGTYYYDAYVPRTAKRSAAVSSTRKVVVQGQFNVTFALDATRADDGDSMGFTGTVRPYLSGARVTLQRQVGSTTTWTPVSLLVPSPTGVFVDSLTPAPDQVNRYRVVVARQSGYRPGASPTRTVTAHPAVPTPTGFRAYPNTAATQALLAWDQVPGTDPTQANNETIVIRRKVGDVPPTSPTDGSLVASLPANLTTYADAAVANGVTYTYSAFVEDGSGDFSHYQAAVVVMPDAPRPVAASWAWPTVSHLDAEHDTPTSVSCPTATFCAAVDAAGAAATYDGSAWSGWTPVDFASGQGFEGGGFRSVSCTSPTFCLAVDAEGRYSVFDGAAWSVPAVARADQRDLGRVACVGPSYCLASDDVGGVITYDGTGWSAPVVVTSASDPIAGLACRSTSFCLGGDTQGNVYAFDGTSWSGATKVFPTSSPGVPAVVGRITCPSTTFCVAASVDHISTFNGTSWSTPSIVATSAGSQQAVGLADVTCLSSTFCAAVDATDAFLFDGTSWTRATSHLDSYAGLTQVSCGSVTMCVAAGWGGESATYDGSTWSMSPGPPMDRTVGPLETVSCPTDSYCMAGETGGQQRTRDAASWTSLSGGLPRGLFGLSCVSSSFCGAYDGYGQIDSWTGSSWANLSGDSTSGSGEASCVNDTAAHPTCFEIDNNDSIASYTPTAGPTALVPTGLTGESFTSSCLADDFCVYVGTRGHAVTQTPSFTITTATLGGRLSGVSCVSDTFCMAVDTTGHFVTYDGSTWSTGEQINYDETTDGVSCASPTACVMVDFAGGVRTWDGRSWSERTSVFPKGRIWDVSCPSGGATCTVVGEDAGYEATATVTHP